MYKIAPLLKEYPIQHAKVMYSVAPIQTVGELNQNSADSMSDANEAAVMARLDALQSRVNTIKSVLAKTPKKTDFGSKFIQKVAPLDIVINFNPAVNSPNGLECLHRQLSSQFKVLTKSHVHSSATGSSCDLFKTSPLGGKDSRKDYQIIFTVIYTCATDDLTAYIGNSRLTGISSVTRFIGRILDIYPPQDVEIENYLDLADLIGDSDSPKKEKMANAKILDQHFGKKKFCCGDAVSLADYAIYSAIGSIDEKTRGKNLQAFCTRMENL